jgi:pSer/pThr/pTyr-binding forkhead associated (FHA) protein
VADHGYFARGDDGSVAFPTGAAARLVPLSGTRTLVGRRSRSRGINPEIDLSAPPEDRGVSRAHAQFDHPPGGRLTVTDLGSANGTWIGDEPRPLVRGVAVELADGARIYLGSWTRITLRSR